MNAIQTHLEKLVTTTSPSYNRWTILLNKDRETLQIILEQIDYSHIERIHEPQIIRLIQQKAKSSYLCQNRSNLLAWCQARLNILLPVSTRRKQLLARFFSYVFLLGQFVYGGIFLLSILTFVTFEFTLTERETSFFFFNIWGAFITTRVLSRLRKRIKRVDLPPVLETKKEWIFYSLGIVLCFLIIPTVTGGGWDLLLADSRAISSILRIVAYLISGILILYLSGTDYIIRKPSHSSLFLLSVILQVIFVLVGIIVYSNQRHDIALFLYIYAFVALMRSCSLLAQNNFSYAPQFNSPYAQFKRFKWRSGTVFWASSLLTYLASLSQDDMIPPIFIIIPLIFSCIVWVFSMRFPTGQISLDLPYILEGPSLIQTNGLLYQISKEAKGTTNEIELHWQRIYLAIRAIEEKGILGAYDENTILTTTMKPFCTFLEHNQCTYLHQRFVALGLGNTFQTTVEAQQVLQQIRQTKLEQLIEWEDLFIQQLPLLHWLLYHYYRGHHQNFKLQTYLKMH